MEIPCPAGSYREASQLRRPPPDSYLQATPEYAPVPDGAGVG
jgi:hypothetical protein